MVCGAPGTGKTRLLLELGRRLAPDYPDGRIYLDLAASTEKPRTPDDAIRGVLDALGVPRPSARTGAAIYTPPTGQPSRDDVRSCSWTTPTPNSSPRSTALP